MAIKYEYDEEEFEEKVGNAVRKELSNMRPTTCPKCGTGLIEKDYASGVKCPKCKWYKLD